MRIKRVACIAALVGTPSIARTEDGPGFTIGSRPALMLLGGLTTGGTVALADRGALVGGVASLARLQDGHFIGLYADGYYDWGTRGTYVTGGLELGHKWVGLDGGVALRFADGTHQVGVSARVTIGLGIAGAYARYAHFGSATRDDNVLQIGLELKLPLWTGGN